MSNGDTSPTGMKVGKRPRGKGLKITLSNGDVIEISESPDSKALRLYSPKGESLVLAPAGYANVADVVLWDVFQPLRPPAPISVSNTAARLAVQRAGHEWKGGDYAAICAEIASRMSREDVERIAVGVALDRERKHEREVARRMAATEQAHHEAQCQYLIDQQASRP